MSVWYVYVLIILSNYLNIYQMNPYDLISFAISDVVKPIDPYV